MEFYSLERQDEFVYALFKNVQNGFFLDIGCHFPYESSNTYVLEKDLNWHGVGFDIVSGTPWTGPFNWSERRPNTKFIQTDVTQIGFIQLIKDNLDINHTIDYVSLDIDGPLNGKHYNFGWEVLPKMINSGIRFKIMTMEHEFYSQGERVRDPSRLLLEQLGYIRLFSDVSFANGNSFEDWWIDPLYFSDNLLQYGGCNLSYDQCIDNITNYLKQ